MEKKQFKCEECEQEYEIHFENDFEDPEYCPFCGELNEDDDDDDDDDDWDDDDE